MTTEAAESASRLDLWIAGTMRPNSDVWTRLSAAGVSIDAAKRLGDEARAAGLYQTGSLTADVVMQFFGAPAKRTPAELVYALTLWPEHVYVWSLDGSKRVMGSGFERRNARVLLSPSQRDQFRCWYHTENDVRKALGEPRSREGWWPEETLIHRGATHRAGTMECTFEHGLLASITTQPVKT
jgi:hypothetical protein